MDDFKSAMVHHCGIGGIKCACCNITIGKKNRKYMLRKTAKAVLKRAFLKELNAD
jgi:hypothetical protein